MVDGQVRTLKVLAVADEVDSRLYGDRGLRARTSPDLILGAGDLPAYYLDYLVSKLNVPLLAIHGNHDAPPPLEGSSGFQNCGASWIDGRSMRAGGLLIAGFDGSLRYNDGAYQYSQGEMFARVRGLVPWLLLNRLRYGRYLDVLLTHAPPHGIHDRADLCHTGFDAFKWLVQTFQPRYHLHGHIHLYDRRAETITRLGATEIMNVYPFRELTLTVPESRQIGRELLTHRAWPPQGPGRATRPAGQSSRPTDLLGTEPSARALGSSATGAEKLR